MVRPAMTHALTLIASRVSTSLTTASIARAQDAVGGGTVTHELTYTDCGPRSGTATIKAEPPSG